MGETTATALKPTPAERVRSLVSVASSMSATANGARGDLHDSLLVGSGQGLRLRAPADSWLVHEADRAPGSGVPACLEWTDVAPVAVRERLRAQVRITGRLHAPQAAPGDAPGSAPGSAPGETATMLLEPRQVALVTEGFSVLVGPAELIAAEPDPVAPFEAALLLHLAEDHQDHVAALTRLLHTRVLLGVTRVTPFALDRYGIVLRLEYHRAHCDVRLPFGEPLVDVEQVGHRIHALISDARRQGRRPASA